MADIRPFRAYRYDTNRVALKDVLTQPYDKITPAMQERYYAASPYNLIAIEKGRVRPTDSAASPASAVSASSTASAAQAAAAAAPADNVYTRAAAETQRVDCRKNSGAGCDASIYVYAQEYLVPGTHSRRTRIGFIALARVEDYDAQVVFPHEHTLSGPKADRIELLRQTRAQTGQLFMLYDDSSRKIETWLEQIARTNTPDRNTR